MRYTFELFIFQSSNLGMPKWVLKDTSLSPHEASRLILEAEKKKDTWRVDVTDNLKRTVAVYYRERDFESFLEGAERGLWKAASVKEKEAKMIKENIAMWPGTSISAMPLTAPPVGATIHTLPRTTSAPFQVVTSETKTEAMTSVKEKVSPSHYKTYFKELQWLEAMQYLPNFREPACFKAAVELQARKYLDRLGGKDFEPQELLKSIWYLRFLAAYIANDNKPILISDISRLID